MTASFPTGLYDVHAHLADPRIANDREQILSYCQREMAGVLTASAEFSQWEDTINLSKLPGIYGALGIHPWYLKEDMAFCLQRLRQILGNPSPDAKIIAIGEIGLDFQTGKEHGTKQIEALENQILLASEFALPVILHNRKSWSEFFSVLNRLKLSGFCGICHNFNSSLEIAKKALDFGLYLSFCGPVTWTEADRLRKVAAYVPADRIFAETDTPDLPPQSARSSQSRPWMVRETIEILAQARKVSPQCLLEQIAQNWGSVFRDALGKG